MPQLEERRSYGKERLRFLRTMLLVTVPLLFFAGLFLNHLQYQHELELASARSLLLSDQLQQSSDIYDSLQYFPWSHTESLAGRAIVDILQLETDPLNVPLFPPETIGRSSLRELLDVSLSKSRYQSCLNLSRYLLRTEPDALDWRLFEAAALLELGRREEALLRLTQLPDHQFDDDLRRRLIDVGLSLSRGSRSFVYDRAGRPVGEVTASGSLVLEPSVEKVVVPTRLLEEVVLPENEGNLRLSVDLSLSEAAIAALKGYRGSIVLLDPRSGEVLVAVSDSVTASRESLPAFTQYREPASISKLITVSAALRAGVDVESFVAHCRCRGAKRYSGGVLYCGYAAGRLGSLSRAMAISCNIAFADLGVKIGREALLNELRLFGFERHFKPGLEFGRIVEPTGGERQLADLSIGLEATAITPLHAAIIAATVANYGRMPVPQLVHANDGLLGLSPRLLSVQTGEEVIAEEWREVLLKSMEAAAAAGGTGFGLSPASLPIAIKTGTGRNSPLGYHTNYVGFAPLEDPQFAFCIRVTDQPNSPRVRRATRIVARRLFSKLAEYCVTEPTSSDKAD